MANNNNFLLNDFGNLSSVFSQVITKYQLSERQQLILNSLKQMMFDKMDMADFIGLLQEELNLDFITAGKIATELKMKILDKKKEIEAIKSNWQKREKNSFSPLNLITDILTQTGLKFTDSALKSRFEKAVLSWFQGIRDNNELRDILTRSSKIGGVGLSEEESQVVLNQVATQKTKAQANNQDLLKLISDYESHQQGIGPVQEEEIDVKAKVAAPKEIAVPGEVTIDQILAQRAKAGGKSSQMPPKPLATSTRPTPQTTPFVEDIKAEDEFLESTEELPAPTQPQSQPQQQPQPAPVEPQRIVPPPVRQPDPQQPMVRKTDTVSTRPQMSDVKFEPKLYGPLDELSAMSLADFRRLSKDPWLAIQKISGKLSILEGESVVRKNDGINALKNSPLYNVYADIMSRALTEGKSFEQVVKERGDITLDEFKAIMELNKSFKY